MKMCVLALSMVLVFCAGCTQTSGKETAATENVQLSESTPPAQNTATESVEISTPVEGETVDEDGIAQEAEVLEKAEAAMPKLKTVESPGILTESGGGAQIDYSNASKGYVTVRFTEQIRQRLKVQVKGPTTTYTYNLTPGHWEAFPLSDEEGDYQVQVYSNVTGNKYALVLSASMTVTLEDPFGPFLHANQYVDFEDAPETVALAWELTGGLSDPLEKVAAVYDYVIANISYDRELAQTVKSGYLPELDRVLEKGKGICFDYAALMTGMLRSQGVPCKLVVGYAGEVYHAWISVYSEKDGWIDNAIYFDGTTWKRMDPTFASSANRSDSIMKYIGDGSNYTEKYIY